MILKLIIALLTLNNLINCELGCMNPYCECSTDYTKLICTQFTSYHQLDFLRVILREFNVVELLPLKTIALDNNLNLNGLNLNGVLILKSINSIDFNSKPFQTIKSKNYSIKILNSNFDTINLFNCDYGNYIFSSLVLNEFTLCNVEFNIPICPFLFGSSIIETFTINNPKGNFIFNTINQQVNANINYFIIKSAKINHLDSINIINRNLFDKIKSLSLIGLDSLETIEDNLFTYFKSMRMLKFNEMDVKNILAISQNWLKNLNSDVYFDIDAQNVTESLRKFIFFMGFDRISFEYPNKSEDIKSFCLFKHFPHNKLIYPYISQNNNLSCTCTIYWLFKHYSKFKLLYEPNGDFIPIQCFQNIDYEMKIKNCDFDRKFLECRNVDNQSTRPTNPTKTTKNNLFNSTQFYANKEINMSETNFYITWSFLVIFIIALLVLLIVCSRRYLTPNLFKYLIKIK